MRVSTPAPSLASLSRAGARALPAVLGLVLSPVACKGGCGTTPPTITGGPSPTSLPAPSQAAPVASATPPEDKFPLDEAQISALVNPSGVAEYTGPTAAIEGVVHVEGGAPRRRKFTTLPAGCAGAVDVHAPEYREGPGRTLGDALVAIIGYDAFVRPSRDDKVVTIRKCSIQPTTIDLSVGQRLMIANDDEMPYLPEVASKMMIQRLVLKGQSPVPLFLTKPGAFQLTWFVGLTTDVEAPDAMVFVLPSALHTVTTLDGKFRIAGVPVGKAKVAVSHLHMNEVMREIDVKPAEVTHVDLTLKYEPPAPSGVSSGGVKLR